MGLWLILCHLKWYIYVLPTDELLQICYLQIPNASKSKLISFSWHILINSFMVLSVEYHVSHPTSCCWPWRMNLTFGRSYFWKQGFPQKASIVTCYSCRGSHSKILGWDSVGRWACRASERSQSEFQLPFKQKPSKYLGLSKQEYSILPY